MVHVEEPLPLVQLGDQVEVPDQLAARPFNHLRDHAVILLGHAQHVPAQQESGTVHGLALPVNVQVFPLHVQVMHRADHVIIAVRRLVRAEILLDAAVHIHPPGVLALQALTVPPVIGDPLPGHAAIHIAGRITVIRKTNRSHAASVSRRGHLVDGVLPVGIIRVDVKITGDHVIFSCLTLWSITCRDASSRCTSSSEMPISVIRTII